MRRIASPAQNRTIMAMDRRALLAGFAGAAGLALACAGGAQPLVLYNGSPSVPVGFYVRTFGAPRLGDFVTVRAAAVAPVYAGLRGFADDSDRFIKRIAAGEGARVCADGARVTIGREAVRRLVRDSAERRLPAWTGCRTLRTGEVFLLGDTDDSFDSRYFGAVSLELIDGVWRPIFSDSAANGDLHSARRRA
jgi:type IV secretory pathway protease TraF